MSADAKAWYDEDGRHWRAIHDGPCRGGRDHAAESKLPRWPESLSEAIRDVEMCMGCELRWEIRQYDGGGVGLVGWEV